MRTEKVKGHTNLNVDEPWLHCFEALGHCDVVHQHHTVRLAKELLGDAAEPASENMGD